MSRHEVRDSAPGGAHRSRPHAAPDAAAPTLGRTLRLARAGRHRLWETRHEGGLALPPHSHGRPTITLVLAGSFRERVDGRTHECRPLDVVFKPGGVEHLNEYSAVGARCFVLEVTPVVMRGLAPEGSGVEERAWFGRGAVSTLALHLYRAGVRGRPSCELAVEELVAELAEDCGRRVAATDVSRAPSWMLGVRDRLHDQANERASLGELAGEAGVHPSHLCRAFRRYFGCTMSEYLRRRRIDEAVRRLASEPRTDLSGLALELGYYDQSHFTREFRRATGGPPGRFRDALPTSM